MEVVAFALLSEMLLPKRFAGLFGAAFIRMNHVGPIGLFHRRVEDDKVGHMESQIRNGTSILERTVAAATGEVLTNTGELVRELDHRVNDRIDVWLCWRMGDDLVFVEVADGKTGDRFVVEVAPGQRPLDVFAHPYAYVGDRRSDVGAEGEL